MWIWQAEISEESYYIVFFRAIAVASYSVYFLLELVGEVCLLCLPLSTSFCGKKNERERKQFRGFIIAVIDIKCLNEVLPLLRYHFQPRKYR